MGRSVFLLIGMLQLPGWACAGRTDDGDNQQPADAQAENIPVDPNCSDGLTYFDALHGTCILGAGCKIRTRRKCPDGFVPPQTPKEWTCECPSGTWECSLVSGGLSIPSCDGHQTDAGE